jgi:seryl-tRNA synthetase
MPWWRRTHACASCAWKSRTSAPSAIGSPRAWARSRGAEREAALEEARTLRERLEASEPELKSLEERLNGLLLTIPNLPAPEVPEGATDEDNVELRRWGAPREFSFTPKDHVELALSLDIADFGRGSKVSGSRFYYLKNEGALLQMALLRYAVDVLVQRACPPMIVPELVREEAMTGTGFFPTGRDDAYTMERDDLYLVGTSECRSSRSTRTRSYRWRSCRAATPA